MPDVSKKAEDCGEHEGADCESHEDDQLERAHELEMDKAFDKKEKYSHFDFLDFYESRRFTTAFQVYKNLHWWPAVDILYSYGHVLNNGIVIAMAIRYHVTFYMGFNLICVCLYYSLATIRLSKRAQYNYELSGL